MILNIVGFAVVGMGLITAVGYICDFLADKITRSELAMNIFFNLVIVVIGMAIIIGRD